MAIAASPGPIFFLCLRRTLVKGWLNGLFSGFGVATADGFYAAVAAFGVGAIATVLTGERRGLELAGGALLVVVGARIVIDRPKSTESASNNGAGLAWAYVSTLGLTITNPATIISFAALAATLGAGSSGGYLRPALLVVGVLLGSVTWWCVLAALAARLRARITPRVVRGISTASGLAIIVLGLAALVSSVVPKQMGYPIHIVDVFTDRALAGNQLAVVLDAGDIAPDVMQRVAREMNFSETTFVMAPTQPGSAAKVRIFTPGTELPFAGHPTIGTAWVLATQGLVPGDALEFTLEEGVGPVAVRGERGPSGFTFWMTHPPLRFAEVMTDRRRIATGLGLDETYLVPDVPLQVATTGLDFLYVALRDKRAVDAAVSEKGRLRDAFAGRKPLPVFLFAAAGANLLYSRMFAADANGIDEDPATGSASGPLGAFAVKYGLVPHLPSVSITSEQGTKMGRQSIIKIRLEYGADKDIPTKIEVGGAVMPVVTGTLVGLDQ